MTSTSITSVLQRLIDASLLRVGDTIEFKFKRHQFTAVVSEGALLSHCTWNGNPIEQTGFQTLTDWCDTCIQEILQEYVTRFSSWKRVRHVRTQRSFTQLRELLLNTSNKVSVQSLTCGCAETKAHRRRIVALEQQVMQLRAQLRGHKSKVQFHITDDNPFKIYCK